MTLAQNIHQIVNEHMTMADDGSINKTRPLLAELRAASGSKFGAAGSGAGGEGMVVNSKAVELENSMKAKALEDHLAMTGTEYRGSLVTLLNAWAIAASNEWQPYLEEVTAKWINDIRELFVSVRPPWRPSIPCPACGQRFYGPERDQCLEVHYWDSEDEKVKPPQQWTANCNGCKAAWDGDNLKWLRAANDTPNKSVAQTAQVG